MANESEQVRVNKQLLSKGTDYRIDYLSGSLTFLKQVMDETDQIDVLYTSQANQQPGPLMAGRYWAAPNQSLKLAGALAYEQGATEALGSSPAARHHGVINAALDWDMGRWADLTMAWAGSRQVRSDEQQRDGQLIKSKLQGTWGPVKLTGHYERSTPDYQMIGGLAYGQDVLHYGGEVDIRFHPAIQLTGDWQLQDRVIIQEREISHEAQALASLGWRAWPTMTYQLYQIQEQFLSPTLLKDHQTKRHTGTINYNQEYWQTSLQVETERRTGQLGIRPSTDTSKLAVALAAKNIAWLTLSANYEWAAVKESGNTVTGQAAYPAQGLTLLGSITPSDRLRVSIDNRWQWDEVYGNTAKVDTKLFAQPITAVKVNGNYGFELLQQVIGTEEEAVSVQTASGQLDFNPWDRLTIRLLPNWRWSARINGQDTINQTQQDMAQLKWAMTPWLSHELEARKQHTHLMNLAELPISLQSDQHLGEGSYRLQAALGQALSGSLVLRYQESWRSNKDSLNDELERAHGREQEVTVAIRSSPAAALRLDSQLTISREEQYGNQPEGLTRTAHAISNLGQSTTLINKLNNYGTYNYLSHHLEAKVTYQLNEWFSCYGQGLLDIEQDLTRPQDTITTTGPGAGLTLRLTGWSVELAAKAATSWGLVTTGQATYQATVQAQPHPMVSLQLRGEHSTTIEPVSELSDVIMSCQISF